MLKYCIHRDFDRSRGYDPMYHITKDGIKSLCGCDIRIEEYETPFVAKGICADCLLAALNGDNSD